MVLIIEDRFYNGNFVGSGEEGPAGIKRVGEAKVIDTRPIC